LNSALNRLRFIIEHLLRVLTPFSVSVKLGLPQSSTIALTTSTVINTKTLHRNAISRPALQ
jgi:hypothetical protein